MATPIKQHTIETYNIYSIVYGNDESTRTKIPMDPRYLIPLLKNDERLIAAYRDDITKSIENYQYASIGELNLTLTVNVVDNEMSIEDFINNVLFTRYDYDNYDSIVKLLSIAACTKALLLSTLFVLYYGDYTANEDLINLKFLDYIEDDKEFSLYNYILTQLNSLLTTVNPVQAADYIPTIEVTEIDNFTSSSLEKFGCELSNCVYVNQPSVYSNLKTLEGNHVYIEEITNVTATKQREFKEMFTLDIYYKNISSIEDTSEPDTWNVYLNDFPTALLMSLYKNSITNNTKNLTFIFPKGFKYKYQHGLFKDDRYDTLEKAIVIKPGETVCLNQTVQEYYMYGTSYYLDHPIQLDTSKDNYFTVQKFFDTKWKMDLYPDQNDESIQDVSFNEETDLGTLNVVSFNKISTLSLLDGNKIQNNTKNTTFILPVGFKYKYEKTNWSFIKEERKTSNVVIVERIITAISWVAAVAESIGNWFSNLFKPKEERVKIEETIIERTEQIVESIEIYLVKVSTTEVQEKILNSSIEILPGEILDLRNVAGDDAKFDGWVLYLPTNSTLNFKYHIPKADQDKTKVIGVGSAAAENPLAFKTRVILDSTTANYINIDDTTHALSMVVPIAYTDYLTMTDYEAKAKFVITDANLTAADIIDARNENGIKDIFTDSKATDISLSVTHEEPETVNRSYTNTIQLIRDATIENSTTTYTYSIDSRNDALELTPNDYASTDSIIIKDDYTLSFTPNTSKLYSELHDSAVKQLKRIKNQNAFIEYQNDILYHINGINIYPSYYIQFGPAQSMTSFTSAQVVEDVNLFAKHMKCKVILPKTSTTTQEVQTDKDIISINRDVKGQFTFPISVTENPLPVFIDLSNDELYYYNGTVYEK